MAKEIACNDLMKGCAFTATAETEDDLLRQVAEHASTAHGVKEVTPELAAQLKAAIRAR
jgi:predicted small metal-binding protein